MKDYSTARFWAISGIGYGKGFTADEARENYVTTQRRNWRGMSYAGPSRNLKAALTEGELRPVVYQAPEGADGFVLDSSVLWTADGAPVRRVVEDDVVDNPHVSA